MRGVAVDGQAADGAVEAASAVMQKSGQDPLIMIDFSHANSSKQHKRQIVVGHDVGSQLAAGDKRIIGVMIESHIVEGRPEIGPRDKMTYGQSVTDACIHWDDTVAALRGLAQSITQRRRRLAANA